MPLEIHPIDCGHFEGTERSAHQYLVGFGEKICSQSIVWVITGGPYPVVVDLPPNRPEVVMERFGRVLAVGDEQGIDHGLERIGISKSEVGAVILSHLHWDHSLGLEDDLYPNATIYLQLEELRYAAAPYPSHAGLYDPSIIKRLVPPKHSEFDNIKLVNGDVELFEGLEILHLPGHTPGLQGILVNTPDGRTAMASDTVPFESSWRGRTMEDWIPEGIHVSVRDCYESLARIARLADVVLPSHDRSVFGEPTELADSLSYGTDIEPDPGPH